MPMAHLDVIHAHEIPTVVQVLFEIAVLQDMRHSGHCQEEPHSMCVIQAAHILTRYSNTRVRQRSVWMMSCSVTMLACFRFFSSDTEGQKTQRE